jgi:hypothetical protein
MLDLINSLTSPRRTSYKEPLKNKDYQQPFRDEHLCLLFSDTEKLTVEVKHFGYLFQASACCPPTNPELHKSTLSDFEKDASSLTIAYTHGSDKRRLEEEKIKAISPPPISSGINRSPRQPPLGA